MNFWTCCCDTSCDTTNYVSGCLSAGLPSATVVAKQAGVTIATATTDGVGKFTLHVPPGVYDITVSRSRFDTTTFTGKTLTCAGSVTLDMSGSISSGYHCTTQCAVPLASTIYLNAGYLHSFAGLPILSLVWATDAWYGSGNTTQSPTGGYCFFNYPTAQFDFKLDRTLTLFVKCWVNSGPCYTTPSDPDGVMHAYSAYGDCSGTIYCPDAGFRWNANPCFPPSTGTAWPSGSTASFLITE